MSRSAVKVLAVVRQKNLRHGAPHSAPMQHEGAIEQASVRDRYDAPTTAASSSSPVSLASLPSAECARASKLDY